LLNVAIFAALGPIVGCVVFFLVTGMLAMGLPAEPFAGMYSMIGLALWTVPAAYIIGSFAAAATGASVAVASSGLRRPSHLYAFAAVVGGAAGMFLARFEGRNPTQVSEQLLMFLTGAVAALVCTRAARPFRLARRSVQTGLAP
jgi:hypothetical protein